MKKIVTFGEILLRLSTKVGKRLHQTDQLQLHYGGAEANVSISLATFGHEVIFVSKVPNNALGLAALHHLNSHGVNTSNLAIGGKRLGTYYVETGVGEREAQVIYDRSCSSFAQVVADEFDLDHMLSGATMFHVSGITPALSPVWQEATRIALKKARKKGVMTSFDFNYRSKLWSHSEASETIQSLLPYVDICSCSELDAVYLLGISQAEESLSKEEKLIYYYKKIQAMYPDMQYLSSTFREVISSSHHRLQGNLYKDGKLYQSRVHQIQPIVDRIGGGDAFFSGVLHGILHQKHLQETISFATTASALKHSVEGDCNLFTEDEINAYVDHTAFGISR